MTDQPDWTTPSGASQPPPPDRFANPGSAPTGGPSASAPPAQSWGPLPPASAAPPAQSWGPLPPAYAAAPADQQAYQAPWAPPRPGVIPLRPLGVGEILDGAVATLRAHPKVMIGLSALVAVATQAVVLPVTWLLLRDLGDTSLGTPGSDSAEDVLRIVGGTAAVSSLDGIVSLIAQLILTGILTVVVSRAVLGEPVSAAEAWSRARPRLPALFGLTALIFLVAGIALALGVLPGLALIAAGGSALSVVLTLVLIESVLLVAVVYFAVVFALAPASVVLERQGVVASLRRSRALVKTAWWRTVGLLVLIQVIGAIVSTVLSLPFQAGSSFTDSLFSHGGDQNDTAFVSLLIVSLGAVVGSAVTWPFTAAATVLIYVDRRIRREGLDLQLARAAGLTTPPGHQSATPGVMPPQPHGP